MTITFGFAHDVLFHRLSGPSGKLLAIDMVHVTDDACSRSRRRMVGKRTQLTSKPINNIQETTWRHQPITKFEGKKSEDAIAEATKSMNVITVFFSNGQKEGKIR